MIERQPSYVGVSGVVSPEQQQQIELIAESAGLGEVRKLLLGVKAVHKTQFLDTENKYGKAWYPVGAKAFSESLRPIDQTYSSLGVAQTFFDPEYLGNPGYRVAFADKIFQRGKDWIDGIQFDMLPWHVQPELLTFLQELKEKYDTKLFLQVHSPAMKSLGPDGVVQALAPFAENLDYVLFDSSHGTGKRLDTDALRLFLEKAYDSPDLATTGLAIAGGLNGTIVREDLPKVLADFPDVSWDAEGQLHPENEQHERPLDLPIVADYLSASAEVIKASN